MGKRVLKYRRDHPLYKTWINMRSRCNGPTDKGYHNYGERGIKVCSRWSDFYTFVADMGPKPTPQHSLDRIDTNGDYEPSNCRWATIIEQNNNMRTNTFVEFRGRSETIANWCRETGVSQNTAHSRIRYGWSMPESLGLVPRQPQTQR